MLLHLLLSLSFSVKRFCLCQANGIGDSCSLQKKCHRYSSQEDIILYKPGIQLNQHNNNNTTFKSIKEDEFIAQDNLVFEVFGSKAQSKTNTIISLDMNDQLFSKINKISIYGGEFNQAVRLQNFNTKLISFEAQNIEIIIENERQLSFNKLTIRNSFLKYSNTSNSREKGKLSIEAREVIGDSLSLSSKYLSLIETEKIKVTDQKDDEPNFGISAPVKIIDKSKYTTIKKNILEDEESRTESQTIYYCLSTTNRLSRSKELAECERYGVPLSNYYSGRDVPFLGQLARSRDNTNYYFYITTSTETDPVRIYFPALNVTNITFHFTSADVDSETRIEIKGNRPLSNSNNITLSVSKISYASFDATYFASFTSVSLYQSPIHFNDAGLNVTINDLTTDIVSLSEFDDVSLIISKKLLLQRALPGSTKGKIILEENCTVEVNQYSNFPFTRYNYESDNKTYYLTLSDSLEDQRFNLYFLGKIVVNYTESSSLPKAPTLTFAGGKTLYNKNDTISKEWRDNCPYINLTVYVEKVGLNVIFGTGSEREVPFPHSSCFTFLNEEPAVVLNLTINDFNIDKYNISDMYILAFYRYYVLNIMTSSTLPPYVEGVNHDYRPATTCEELFHCSTEDLPFFLGSHSCYGVGAYSLTRINMDVQDQLESIQYQTKFINVKLKNFDKVEKFPDLYKEVEFTTNTSSEVLFSATSDTTASSKLTNIILNLESTPTLRFSNSFSKELSAALSNLKINHDKNDLLLIGDGIPVPNVTLNYPVAGVLFESTATSPYGPISTSTFSENTRYGPAIKATVAQSTTYPQTGFLAEYVSFTGSNSPTLTFEYYNPSRVYYSFEDVNVKFVNAAASSNSGSGGVSFRGKSILLGGDAGIKQDSNVPLTIDVDFLILNRVSAIPESSVTSPVIVRNSIVVNVGDQSDSSSSSGATLLAGEGVKQIIFGEDKVTFVDDANQRSAPLQQSDSGTQTQINVNQSSPIQVSVEDGAESVPPNVNMVFKGDAADLDFDKSWSGVDIPTSFVADFRDVESVKLSSEMMHIPDINFEGLQDKSATVSTHKQKLTKDLAFWIFVGITLFVFAVGLILCIVGLTCCRYVEELDISSSAEGNSEIGAGELDGLPYTAAEREIRARNKSKIREARDRQIEEKKRKEEKMRRRGMLPDDEELNSISGEERFEEAYFNDSSERDEASAPPPRRKKKKSPTKQQKDSSETSEEFGEAKRKAQMNAASGAAQVPNAPPQKKTKPAESENDAPPKEEGHQEEEASYNDSFSNFSD